ncbi:uncharacterized protein LOC109950621 [Prunus persica]|uniref:uncharacterized protein LOC109950621 n=1 Tax=Prunus persica TaxID=3760 RepID=UPI0009AB8E17|nr:uncharacterized protein LOC109950621 [Prunus persica]
MGGGRSSSNYIGSQNGRLRVDPHLLQIGIPYVIITDNDMQFDSELFREFCACLKVNLFFASPAHRQSNSQVEAINKIIKKLLKRQLDKAKGAWLEKLPDALWAIWTFYQTSTEKTPFSLSFSSKVVVPLEICETSYRMESFAPKMNEEALALSLDLIELGIGSCSMYL